MKVKFMQAYLQESRLYGPKFEDYYFITSMCLMFFKCPISKAFHKHNLLLIKCLPFDILCTLYSVPNLDYLLASE